MAAYTYEYRVNPGYAVPAQVVGELCEQLEGTEEGLTPHTFIEASRDPSSPTHIMLEWNDDIAAEKYREHQARKIIGNIRIVKEENDTSYLERGFVSIPGGTNTYVTMQSALNRDDWRKHLLDDARRDMECFKAKYRRLTELAAVIAEMDKVTSQVG